MAGRIGGTTEEMHRTGSQFNSEADQLHALVGRITSTLNGTDWEGGAADRFKDQWNTQFVKVFQQVETGLRECSQEINRRADALTQVGG